MSKNDDNKSEENNVNETPAKDDKSADIIKSRASASSAAGKNPVKSKRSMSPILLTVLLAFPIAAVIAYIASPGVFNQYLSMAFSGDDVKSEVKSVADTGSHESVPQAASPAALQNNAVTDWQAKRRAEFEQRRAERAQQPAGNYPASRYPRQWTQSSPPEPPQWVKDRQAEMEKQRQQYMKEMSEYQASWANNQVPQHSPEKEYFSQNVPQQGTDQAYVNPYQQNSAVNAQPPQPMMPHGYYQPHYQQYNPYPYPAQQYYYAAPMQYYAPHNRPYAYPGYR